MENTGFSSEPTGLPVETPVLLNLGQIEMSPQQIVVGIWSLPAVQCLHFILLPFPHSLFHPSPC